MVLLLLVLLLLKFLVAVGDAIVAAVGGDAGVVGVGVVAAAVAVGAVAALPQKSRPIRYVKLARDLSLLGNDCQTLRPHHHYSPLTNQNQQDLDSKK